MEEITQQSTPQTQYVATAADGHRIEVKKELCIGAASCVAVAPNTFALDEENIAIIVNPNGEDYNTVLMAAQACPTKAIFVHDANGAQVWP